MTPEQEALREKVMREFTGHIASTCCHRTGGVNDDPKCECRVLADAAIAVVLKELKEVTSPTKEELREMAGIPHLPTDLTYECRLALCDEGPRACDWSDKPHRLVFDLCREVERLTAERDAALNPSGSPAAS